ncbi:MAG: YfhO family protein [Candidatus Methylacidiphilales bacterium]|nr:YfhO family protein [Candidatus Methylacidiphilales bacterium]
MEHPGFAASLYLALLLIVLGPVIFSSESRILSLAGTDLWGQFMSWREFGFSELKKGNLPLWNPYVYCGIPYFSGFQSALLYPPNWIHLFLPLPVAVNAAIVFHLWAGGLSAYAWLLWGRSLHPLAALLGGVLYLFCGPHFLHVPAGHLTNLCVMAWVPLIFLAVDRWLKFESLKPVLLGCAVVAFQVLAGHPQYVFFAGIMSGIYTLVMAFPSVRKSGLGLLGLAAMYVGGAGLSAVQLLPGILANFEGSRGSGMTFDQARIFSFPMENFATLLVPALFGDLGQNHYVGRWLFWEMIPYVSVGAVVLGWVALNNQREKAFRILAVTFVAAILALGAYTPLFGLLHAHVPGFALFRGQSKFILHLALALIALASLGLHTLLSTSPKKWGVWTAVVFLLPGLFLFGFSAIAASAQGTEWVRDMVLSIRSTGEVLYAKVPESSQWQARASAVSWAFASAGGFWLAAWAGIVFLASRPRVLACWIIALASVEMGYFAHSQNRYFCVADFNESFPLAYFEDKNKDDRVFFEMGNNIPMFHGWSDIWGSDPALPARYAAFIAVTQGYPFEQAGQAIAFRGIHASYPMLRLRYVCHLNRETGKLESTELGNRLPVADLIDGVVMAGGLREALNLVTSPRWNYREQVVLENRPLYIPGSPDAGTAQVVEAKRLDSDTFRLNVTTSRDTVLLLTENYASGWQARSRTSGKAYPVYAANATQMGIPIGPGRHDIVLEYTQRGLGLGALVSAISLLGWLWLCLRGRSGGLELEPRVAA